VTVDKDILKVRFCFIATERINAYVALFFVFLVNVVFSLIK